MIWKLSAVWKWNSFLCLYPFLRLAHLYQKLSKQLENSLPNRMSLTGNENTKKKCCEPTDWLKCLNVCLLQIVSGFYVNFSKSIIQTSKFVDQASVVIYMSYSIFSDIRSLRSPVDANVNLTFIFSISW